MEKANEVMKERFGKDSLMALATVDEQGRPWVRTVDALFFEGSFYTITYALSNKILHIEKNPVVGVSGEWFSGHAIAENMGYIRLEHNDGMADRLRDAFAAWYLNGHVNEEDQNTIILRMKLTDGILYADGTRYELNYN